MLNLTQQKEEETIWCQNQIFIIQSFFTVDLLATEIKKTEILKHKSVSLGFSILELSKTLMYEFWYNCLKPKYGEKSKLCFMDTDSFIVHVKTWYLQRHCRGCWNNIRYLDRSLPNRRKSNWIGER